MQESAGTVLAARTTPHLMNSDEEIGDNGFHI